MNRGYKIGRKVTLREGKFFESQLRKEKMILKGHAMSTQLQNGIFLHSPQILIYSILVDIYRN